MFLEVPQERKLKIIPPKVKTKGKVSDYYIGFNVEYHSFIIQMVLKTNR